MLQNASSITFTLGSCQLGFCEFTQREDNRSWDPLAECYEWVSFFTSPQSEEANGKWCGKGLNLTEGAGFDISGRGELHKKGEIMATEKVIIYGKGD